MYFIGIALCTESEPIAYTSPIPHASSPGLPVLDFRFGLPVLGLPVSGLPVGSENAYHSRRFRIHPGFPGYGAMIAGTDPS